MATDLAKLVVRLEAETAKYSSELEKANRKLEAFGKRSGAVLSTLKKTFAALGGALIARELGQMVQSSIKAADEASKLSQRIGVATETITGLRTGLELSGSSMDQFASAMSRLNRSISDASFGLKTQQRAFDDLGISVVDSSGKLRSTEDVLFDLADRFASMEDGVRKSARAQELLGRSGGALIPLLNQGAEGLRANIEEGRELGRVWSTETAKAAEEFNDKLTRMGQAAEGTADKLAQRLLPVLNDIADALLQVFRVGERGAAQDDIVKSLTALSQAQERFFQAQRRIGDRKLSEVTAGTAAEFSAASLQLQIAVDRYEASVQKIKDLDKKDALRRDKTGNTPPPVLFDEEAFAKEQAKAEEALQEFFQAKQELETDFRFRNEQALQEQFQAEQDIRDRALLGIIEGLQTEEEKIRSSYERRLQIILENTAAGTEAQEQLIQRLGEQQEKQLAKLSEAANEMSVFAEQAARNMQDAFADFLFDPFNEGLEGMLQGFANIIRRMIAQAAAAQIFNTLGGYGGIFTAFFGGARAHGGPVDRGKSYLVGERGPEMFVPAVSGQIVPNAGGNVVHINQNIDARGASDPAQMVAIARVAKDQAKSEILDLIRRGRI